MELGIDVEKFKGAMNPKHLKRVVVSFLLKRMNYFIYILMFLLTGFFVFLWYTHIYNSQWDELKKQEYINSKDKGVVFNERVFNDIVQEMDSRNQEFQKTKDNLEDIFRLKK